MSKQHNGPWKEIIISDDTCNPLSWFTTSFSRQCGYQLYPVTLAVLQKAYLVKEEEQQITLSRNIVPRVLLPGNEVAGESEERTLWTWLCLPLSLFKGAHCRADRYHQIAHQIFFRSYGGRKTCKLLRLSIKCSYCWMTWPLTWQISHFSYFFLFYNLTAFDA